MRNRAVLLLLAAGLSLLAQATLTLDQLVSFITSSIRLKHPDRKVADYLRGVKLSNRLSERTIIELQAAGAGPRTVEALRALQAASSSLPEPRAASPQAAAPEIPAPSPAEWKKVLEDTREYALDYTHQLPDFICTQVTRRYVDPAGLEFWQAEDTLTARLSYFEQKEDYKLVSVNGRYTDMPYQAVGGAISQGEFGSMMREIFERSSETTFRWERWATLRGRRMHVFTYKVEQARSKWTIEYEKRNRVTPGYHGLIYVDQETGMVTRITLEADGVPPSFPIQQVSSTLDYDYAEIGEQKHMLPLRAVMRMREARALFKNEVEFRLYRKFAADATISFETPEPLPEEQLTEQPPRPQEE
ncbi:MAG: hypothetical protein IT159_07540 [Bryobacterales bacterium]|nr:hypothetical protein [Bryobacterales bacterium]